MKIIYKGKIIDALISKNKIRIEPSFFILNKSKLGKSKLGKSNTINK